MRKLTRFAAATLLFFSVNATAQWVRQTIDTTASFRGLAVVNEKVVWASGTGGTVIRTIDGGKTWKVMTVAGAEKLDFRDIEAFDANTAYILSIGNGDSSRIYKTINGGKTWNLEFKNPNQKAFFDALACRGRQDCIAMSDPVDSRFLLVARSFISKVRGGPRVASWVPIHDLQMPAARDGEAAFAASGTCLIRLGSRVYLVTGGVAARVFRSTDDGSTWKATETQIKGEGGGIFSIAMFDPSNGVVVGGDYSKPDQSMDNLAFSTDGGATWKLGTGLTGYRSGVAYVDRNTIIAVGTNGSDISRNGGKTWSVLGKEDLNAVQSKGAASDLGGRAAGNGRKNEVTMQNFTSIPFKTNKYHGLAEINGFAKFSSAGVVLEFESKLLGLVSLGIEDARIPITEILDVKFKKGIFKRGAKIEIRTRSLAAMAGLPSEDGKLILKLKAEDFERGHEAAQRFQNDLADHAASLPPPRTSIASIIDGSEDDTGDLAPKREL